MKRRGRRGGGREGGRERTVSSPKLHLPLSRQDLESTEMPRRWSHLHIQLGRALSAFMKAPDWWVRTRLLTVRTSERLRNKKTKEPFDVEFSYLFFIAPRKTGQLMLPSGKALIC